MSSLQGPVVRVDETKRTQSPGAAVLVTMVGSQCSFSCLFNALTRSSISVVVKEAMEHSQNEIL